jgi:hypothetical protein
MPLGISWQRRFGIPFVLDLQDPWVSDYHDAPQAPRPPGGRLKYGMMQRLARFQERATLKYVRHVISVSAAYPNMLKKRYSFLRSDQFTVLPFGAPELDFDILHRAGVRQSVFDKKDGRRHWVYVGRAGDDMGFALSSFFTALTRARSERPQHYNNLRIHFVGTTYVMGDRAMPSVAPIAARFGVGDLVEERAHRIPYFEGLQCLIEADALIVPGSDDPTYTASKIYPYVLARRPLLAIFHERSSVVDVIRQTEAGIVVPFGSGASVEESATRILATWFRELAPIVPNTNWQIFSQYSAREMTRRQCGVFDRAIDLHR